jgi:hypothetical protein
MALSQGKPTVEMAHMATDGGIILNFGVGFSLGFGTG